MLRKTLLICIIGATAAAPAFFIQLNEPSFRLNAWKLLAKIGSLCGTMLIIWQFFLGYRQAAARWATPDYLWLLKLHKRIGIAIGLLILLHPIFITPYYLVKHDMLLYFGSRPAPLPVLVPLGVAALVILLFIVLSSTFLRGRMRRDVWYATHLGSYLLPPMAFVHGFPIGTTLNNTGLRFVWQGLFVVMALFYIWRVCARLGVFSSV